MAYLTSSPIWAKIDFPGMAQDGSKTPQNIFLEHFPAFLRHLDAFSGFLRRPEAPSHPSEASGPWISTDFKDFSEITEFREIPWNFKKFHHFP